VGVKGKGKGKVGGHRAEPTREEKSDWVGRSKNTLRWQRRVYDDGGIPESVFSAGEAPLDLEALGQCFAREAVEEPKGPRAVTSSVQEPVCKQILWEASEKQDPKKRRTSITILMRTWEKLADVFLERLGHLQLEAIVSDPDFNEDLFEQLIDMVKSVTKVEWARLKEEDAESKYEWDRPTEGFFKRLQAISYFRQRLLGLHGHLAVDRELQKLHVRVAQLGLGVREVQRSEVLGVVLRKVLHIGNCLNAGSGGLGRADGFDVVSLLEKTLLIDMPKGSDGKTSLLQYIKDKELSLAQRHAFGELYKKLQGWKAPSGRDDEADPSDLGELQRNGEELSQQLKQLEGDLSAALSRHTALLAAPSHREGCSASEEGRRRHLEAQLVVLRGYGERLRVHRRRLDGIECELEAMKEELPALQRYLLHVPPEKKRLSAARILAAMTQLAQRLALQKEPPGSKEGGARRRGASMEPEPPGRREAAAAGQPLLRRSASVDSALPVVAAKARAPSREPSREPARGRTSKFSPFVHRRPR